MLNPSIDSSKNRLPVFKNKTIPHYFCILLKRNNKSPWSLCLHCSFTRINGQVCVCFFRPLPDGVGEHRSDTGHVFGDSGHLPVPSHGHGGRPGVCQLTQLQWDWSGEKHVVRRSDETVPPPGCVLLLKTRPALQLEIQIPILYDN